VVEVVLQSEYLIFFFSKTVTESVSVLIRKFHGQYPLKWV